MVTKVVLLGTGTPNSEPGRSGTCIAIVVDDRPYLFDAGPGIVRKAQAAFTKGIPGLDPRLLERVFLTHLHSDHTTGLPDLMLAPWVLGRNVPLEVFGPPGTKAMMEHLHEAYILDIKVRMGGLEQADTTGHNVKTSEIGEGPAFRDDLLSIEAFEVEHTSFDHAYGFRITTGDKKIAISGDCRPTRNLEKNYRDLDLLFHEVYSSRGYEKKDPKWKRYHRNAHTSSRELAEILKRTRPKLTVLYHQLLWGSAPGELLEEITEIYDGKVIFGNDLDVF